MSALGASTVSLTSSHLGQADNKARSLDRDVVNGTPIVAAIERSQILEKELARDVSDHQSSLIREHLTPNAHNFYCAG